MWRDVASWGDVFYEIACVIARRSKDPSTQVGAVIVSPEHRVLSLGYNGTPRGVEDEDFPWEDRQRKYSLVIHAERNAVLNYRGSLRDLVGATVYVTHSPCNECLKELVQVGVERVVYGSPYRGYTGDPLLPIKVEQFATL